MKGTMLFLFSLFFLIPIGSVAAQVQNEPEEEPLLLAIVGKVLTQEMQEDLLIGIEKENQEQETLIRMKRTLRGLFNDGKRIVKKRFERALRLENNTFDLSKIDDGDVEHTVESFISEGTKTTAGMSERERVGMLASYKDTFKKFPENQKEWVDVLRLANGFSPAEKDILSEENAAKTFLRIYGRNFDKNNDSENSAIAMMAYGVRPLLRDLEAEARATFIFRKLYNDLPRSTQAWNVIRAIAYSGVERE